MFWAPGFWSPGFWADGFWAGEDVVPVQGALVGDRNDSDGTRAPRFAEAMRAPFINTDRTAVLAQGDRTAALGTNRQPQEAGGRPAGSGGNRPAKTARTTR